MSSAATAQLASFFGNNTAFTMTSDGLPPNPSSPRTYASFSDAIAEVALARIAAGIHFRYACEAAVQMGAGVANYASATQMLRQHGAEGDDDDD